MAENERSYQAGGNNDFDGLPRICFTASQVASGNHCKTLETIVETSAWQPLALVTSRVNQRGNHWLGSHQARVRGCEPEVRTSVRTYCRCAPKMRTNRAY